VLNVEHASFAPAYLMTEQPTGWLPEVLPKILDTTPSPHELFPGGDPAELQRARWTARTGIAPEDSHFTVILPVYNEEKEIVSSFGSVMMSDIPADVDAQFVWVVNNATDRSYEKLLYEFQRIGVITAEPVYSDLDVNLGSIAPSVRKGNVKFLLLRTGTAGKANAINVGNEFALRAGHRVAINVDSDCYLEPDAIQTIFHEASITLIGNDTALIDGYLQRELKGNAKKAGVISAHGSLNDRYVSLNGPLFAWSPPWLRQIGGIKESLVEDYGLGLEAYLQHQSVHHGNSRIWANYPDGKKDEFQRQVRQFTGLLQLKRIFDNPEARDVLYHDFRSLRKAAERMQMYQRILKQEKGLMGRLNRIKWFAFHEFVRLAGFVEYSRQPKAKTWKKIRGTDSGRR
jgi:glycosyltransferase involved in cell wall biosynthesis